MSSDRYSQHAKQALRLAHVFARHSHHLEVDTDHLFLGILETEGSLGHDILAEFEINLSLVSEAVALLHDWYDNAPEKLPFSKALRNALAYAVAESQWLDHDYIGTEHFLLGLMRSGQGQFSVLLHDLDLSADQIRGRIKRLLQDGTTEITMEAAYRMARLSELGRRVFFAAEYLASQYSHAAIAPQHLLLALAQEQRGVAYEILPECGLDIDALEEDVMHLTLYGSAEQAITNKLVDAAVGRAEILGTHYTGTEHMLLAMTVDPAGQDLLSMYGVDLHCLQSYLRGILVK